MTGIEFLNSFNREDGSLELTYVFWLKANVDLPLFTSIFVRALAEYIKYSIVVIDCSALPLQEIYAKCSVSFLGQSMLYWFKGIQELSLEDRRALRSFVAGYQGPHRIVYSDDQAPNSEKNAQLRVIEAEDKVTATSYSMLYLFLYRKHADDKFCQFVFKRVKHISLDNACILAAYNEMLGRRYEFFLTHWLERLWTSGVSLFTLSQYFFSKDKISFLQEWKRVGQLYPDEFWVVYWAEQLWQALSFLDETQRLGPKIDHKMYGRLPFSFKQRDWRTYSKAELVQAHDYLSHVDFRLKNSVNTLGLDLFCLKFISNQFSKAS